jgi:hypothetical protein
VTNPLASSTVIETSLKIPGALAAAALWFLAVLPTGASAQVQHTSTRYENENGIKVGEGRLHPYFDYEMHYDSAAGFFDYGGATGVLRPEAIAHFRPGINLDVPMTTSQISLDGNVDYVWYTGWLTPGSSSASRVQAAADGSADFNQGGSVEFDITDHFARSDRTANAGLGVGAISMFNEARAQMPLRPGGRALEIIPNGAFAFESFKSISSMVPAGCDPNDPNCQPSRVSEMNYQNYRLGLDARWRFLPKTALTFESRVDTRDYTSAAVNPSALVLKTAFGLAGLVSPKVATVIKLGWAQDFRNTGLHTIVALAELSYLISETSNVKVGYLRDGQPVPFYGTYRNDRGYLESRFFLIGRMTLHAAAAIDRLSFNSASGRNDTLVTVDVGPEYQFTKWLVGAAGYLLGLRSSNFTAASYNYTRNEFFIRATFVY